MMISFRAGAVDILTYHNDNSRDGANLNENTLTPANVNSSTFGKLFTYQVDGNVYAQPLYMSGVSISGKGKHDVVFVATEHNSVYAFEADSDTGANGGLLWQVNLGTAVPTPNDSLPFQAITPEVGITGTPVIDPGSHTLYVDAFTWDGVNFFHYLHALNIADGSERPFSPVLVAASVPGVGNGSVNGTMSFQASQELQRSALTLAGGVVYVCYAGYTDTPVTDPFHGWLLGYSASKLRLLPNDVFCTTPNGTTAQFGSIAGEGGIWMSGCGPAADGANNLYFATGDGNFTAFAGSGGTDYGSSILKLSTKGGLSVADYFTVADQAYDQANDIDVGAGGVVLLPNQPGPNPHLLVAAGKTSFAYLVNRDQMTTDNQHIDTNGEPDNIVQSMPLGGGAYDTPAYFDGNIYYIATGDVIRSYQLSSGMLVPDLPNSFGSRNYGYPGATPFVSANGSKNGIVWAIQNGQPAVLVAYDANNLSTELYNSSQSAADQLTGGIKFAAPIVADGKVFVGSQNAVSVFGLLSADSGGGGSSSTVVANYSGLFLESTGAEVGRSGSVTISTSKNGNFSGKASVAGRNASFHGKLDLSGAGTASSSGKSGVLTLSFQISADSSAITGTVSGDGWVADLTANRQVFSKKSNPAPFAGSYNLTFAGPGNGDPTLPQNDGSGTATVSTSGQVKFKGVLGDGTKVSQSSIVAPDGDWPLYVPLYGKQGGQIIGWLNFDSGNVSGQPSWIKLPNDKSKSFPAGFNLNPPVSGSQQ